MESAEPSASVTVANNKLILVIDPMEIERLPVYRVMDRSGKILRENQDPKFTKEQAVKMYKAMIKTNEFDRVMYDAQRQGRVSFYMTNYG